MDMHSATRNGYVSFAEECKRILQHHADEVSSLISTKSKKREDCRKFLKKKYHIQNKEKVPHKNLKMIWTNKLFQNLQTVDSKH